MDGSEPAVLEGLRGASYPPQLIHGHTHRPARHVHQVADHACERSVLGDWYERGSYMRCDAQGCASHRVTAAYRIPRAKSALMSSSASSPTATRNSPSPMPAAARASGVMRP